MAVVGPYAVNNVAFIVATDSIFRFSAASEYANILCAVLDVDNGLDVIALGSV